MSSPQAAGTAGGSPQHTPNQPATTLAGPTSLNEYQLKLLFGAVQGTRVRTLQGMAHMEAWDIRRELIRVFGFGGWSVETMSLELVAETSEERRKKNREGQFFGDPYMAWTVVYRAMVRLTVKDTAGRVIAVYEDGAAGDSVNQPSRGDAHDMGMKTALSQALKRCAVNLGDQFGLSLYNNGSRDAVVCWSAAHPPASIASAPAVPEKPEDPPVQPEPQPADADTAQPVEHTPAPVEAPAPQGVTAVDPDVVVAHPEAQALADKAAEAKDRDAAHAVWREAADVQLLNAVMKAPDTGDFEMLRDYLTRRGQQLAQAPAEREVTAETIAEQAQRVKANAVALQQVLAMAQKHELAGELMPGDPMGRTIGQALRAQIGAVQQSPTVTAEQAGAVPAQRERGAA